MPAVARPAGGGDTPRAQGGRTYTLLGRDRRPYRSAAPGRLGGHRKARIYGRLDCPSARRAIAAGGYVSQRVFFADQQAAVAAGYRPCAVCLPGPYADWKAISGLTARGEVDDRHADQDHRGPGPVEAVRAALVDAPAPQQ
jgi:hypothetical protein